LKSGLPDGMLIFSDQKYQLRRELGILEGLAIEDVGIFYGHLVYILPFGIYLHILPFGIFYGYLLYFSRFGMLYREKSGTLLKICEKITKMMFGTALPRCAEFDKIVLIL
jgi:hypothetical protein